MPTSQNLRRLVSRASLLVAILGLSLAQTVHADRAERTASPDAARPVVEALDTPGQTRFAPTRRGGATPFSAQLRAGEQEHAEALAALRLQLDSAARPERPGIQQRIEALKLAREARLVALQLREARRNGRAPLVVKLERRLARLASVGAAMPVIPTGGDQ